MKFKAQDDKDFIKTLLEKVKNLDLSDEKDTLEVSMTSPNGNTGMMPVSIVSLSEFALAYIEQLEEEASK